MNRAPHCPLRRGSILLFCLAMVAALAVLAYGFVRVAQLHRETGDSANIRLLSRQAAQTGTNHAIELLLRDFVTEPFSRMDAPGVRSFSPHDFPYTNTNAQESTEASQTTGGAPLLNVNDMPNSDCFDGLLWGNSKGGHLAFRNGYMNETGRGRFYEPEFYNLPASVNYNRSATPFSYNAAITDPTVVVGSKPPVKFGNAYPQTLDRSGGIFYDDRFCRITDPDPRVARSKARYRLRYGVVVLDLDGMLLVNGDPSVAPGQIKTNLPSSVIDDSALSGVRTPVIHAADVPFVQRIVRNQHRIPAIVDAFNGWGLGEGSNRFLSGGSTGGVAAEHVFIGRGSAGNVDKHPATNFAPSTFSYMYRDGGDFGLFLNSFGADGRWPGPRPYQATVGSVTVSGDVNGGEVIPYKSSYPPVTHSTFVHMLMGPQYTFMDYLHATYADGAAGVDSQGMSPIGRFSPFGRGVSQRGTAESISRYRANVDTPWCVNLLTAPPRLVSSMVSAYMPPGAITAIYTRQDAPAGWQLFGDEDGTVNPTPFAAPFDHPFGSSKLYLHNGTGTIRAGDIFTFPIYATLTPATVQAYRVVNVNTYAAGDVSPNNALVNVVTPVTEVTITPALKTVVTSPVMTPPFAHANGLSLEFEAVQDFVGIRKRDLFIRELSPAFSNYAGPIRLASGPNPDIQPDFHVDDFWQTFPASTETIHRRPDMRYPGVIAYNGYDPDRAHVPGTLDMKDHWQYDQLGVFLRSVKSNPEKYDWSNRYLTNAYQAAGSNMPDTHGNMTFWYTKGTTDWRYGASYGPNFSPLTTQWLGLYSAQIGPHPQSIWEIIGQAMGAAVAVVKGQHYQYANEAGQRPPDQWFNNAAWGGAKAQTIRDLDDLFVRNLGSDPAFPNDPNPVPIWYSSASRLVSATPTWNLAALNDQNPKAMAMATNPALMPPGSPTPNLPIYAWNLASEPAYDSTAPSYTATERTQCVEMIINDFRMSFFGASPQYGNEFRVYDLNGDGKAACSSYPQNGGATANEQAFGIDRYTTNVDPATGIAIDRVADDAGNTFFSNTGTFIMGKSRFWRILVRGEVWDNVLNTTIDRAQLDTVLCIDPLERANELGSGVQNPGGGMFATHIISQIWSLNGARDFLPKRY